MVQGGLGVTGGQVAQIADGQRHRSLTIATDLEHVVVLVAMGHQCQVFLGFRWPTAAPEVVGGVFQSHILTGDIRAAVMYPRREVIERVRPLPHDDVVQFLDAAAVGARWIVN